MKAKPPLMNVKPRALPFTARSRALRADYSGMCFNCDGRLFNKADTSAGVSSIRLLPGCQAYEHMRYPFYRAARACHRAAQRLRTRHKASAGLRHHCGPIGEGQLRPNAICDCEIQHCRARVCGCVKCRLQGRGRSMRRMQVDAPSMANRAAKLVLSTCSKWSVGQHSKAARKGSHTQASLPARHCALLCRPSVTSAAGWSPGLQGAHTVRPGLADPPAQLRCHLSCHRPWLPTTRGTCEWCRLQMSRGHSLGRERGQCRHRVGTSMPR